MPIRSYLGGVWGAMAPALLAGCGGGRGNALSSNLPDEQELSPNQDGSVEKFDDLPLQYQGNLNTTEVPYNRKSGDAPAFGDAEVDDVIVFLQTLTDGHRH